MTLQLIDPIYQKQSQERFGKKRKFPLRTDSILGKDPETDSITLWLINPVSINEFVKDYVGLAGLSKPQEDVLTSIFPKTPAEGEKVFNVEQAILRVGQGGGKNYTITVAVVYAIYLWCCLRDPHRHFDLEYHEPFDILNYSQVNEKQARNVFFRTLSNLLKRVKDPETKENWFTKNMGFKVADYGRKDIKDKELNIPNRRRDRGGIRVYCLDSTAKSVEGYTIWMFIMDEPSRANTPVKYGTAKKQYETALTNAQTRFEPHQYLGCMFAYPEQEVNDLLIETYTKYADNPQENSHEIHENILTAWYDTYVFNPKKNKSTYLKAHKTDPIDADRRWRAIVPPNEFGFFMPHMGKIEECANPNIHQPVKWKSTLTQRMGMKKGKKVLQNYTAVEVIKIEKDEHIRRWGGDFAVSKDSLTIVGGYMRKADRIIPDYVYTERKDGIEVENKVQIEAIPVIDTIIVWQPKKGSPVDYVNVEDTIIKLFRDYFPNSRSLHFDKYNTEGIKQKLLDIGIYDCETLSFSNPQQINYGRLTRHLIWNNAIEYPDNKMLMREMRRLLLLNNAKIDHPNGSNESKDIWDALIIAVNNLVAHSYEHGALSIDMGENYETKRDTMQDTELYEKAFKGFIKLHKREPNTNKELSDYMRQKMKTDKTTSQIEYMKQSWQIEREERERKIPGMERLISPESGNIDMGYDDRELEEIGF